jgi:hypothetical protein
MLAIGSMLAVAGALRELGYGRDDVRRDPVFRAQFHTMCANVGVDPLASNKGMWAQLLHFGDFYYELGVQIVEACLATRSMNGGLMDLELLRTHVTVCALCPATPQSICGWVKGNNATWPSQ